MKSTTIVIKGSRLLIKIYDQNMDSILTESVIVYTARPVKEIESSLLAGQKLLAVLDTKPFKKRYRISYDDIIEYGTEINYKERISKNGNS